jgi:hypothetical protein
VKINVKANLAPVLLQINTVKRQLPFVAARALTVTAQAARTRAITEMEQRFDRPKPYTTRQAMQVRKASKESLTAELGIGVEYDAPSKGTPYEKVLAHHFAGGQRRFTKFEGALRRAGLIGSGEIVVPGGAAPLDPFGNLSQGTIVKLMSVLRLFTEQGYSANETSQGKAKREKVRQRRRKGGGFDYEVRTSNGKKVRRNYVEIGGKVYFVSRGRGHWFGRGAWRSGRSQNLPAGIWEKTGIHGVDVKPLVMFVRAGSYAQRFDLKAIVDDVFASNWNRNFNESFRSAMVSAR